ncbi:hypothetical protein MKEN_00515600 [Mycena kentingensis (nom. inval.)]|nr:hypothetical protein MKEN_00515600 [Mycena kentingensis (nom. inval.)]
MFRRASILVAVFSILLVYLRVPVHSIDDIYIQLTTGNVLLLTAHPDDECMFFAPTILALTALQQQPEDSGSVYSACLSVGNADGLGSIRKHELGGSLDLLGIDTNKRFLVDHPSLQDNFTAQWDASTIADVLKPFVLDNRITTILTFDKYGVSGHPNHKALPDGVKELMRALPDVRLFTLRSLPLPIKYLTILAPTIHKVDLDANAFLKYVDRTTTAFFLDQFGLDLDKIPRAKLATPEPVYVSGVNEYMTAVQAMREHDSQLVWYRWLWIGFSRYMWVNHWDEVKL